MRQRTGHEVTVERTDRENTQGTPDPKLSEPIGVTDLFLDFFSYMIYLQPVDISTYPSSYLPVGVGRLVDDLLAVSRQQ